MHLSPNPCQTINGSGVDVAAAVELSKCKSGCCGMSTANPGEGKMYSDARNEMSWTIMIACTLESIVDWEFIGCKASHDVPRISLRSEMYPSYSEIGINFLL